MLHNEPLEVLKSNPSLPMVSEDGVAKKRFAPANGSRSPLAV